MACEDILDMSVLWNPSFPSRCWLGRVHGTFHISGLDGKWPWSPMWSELYDVLPPCGTRDSPRLGDLESIPLTWPTPRGRGCHQNKWIPALICFVSLVVIVIPLLEKVCLVIGLWCLKVRSFLAPGEHLLVEGITCGRKLKHFLQSLCQTKHCWRCFTLTYITMFI